MHFIERQHTVVIVVGMCDLSRFWPSYI